MKALAITAIVLISVVMLIPISNVYADPITSIFSSGLDGSGNPLAGGASDTHYEVVETGNQAVVRTSLPGTYFPNDANSQWIWENANGLPINVVRTFKTTFDLTGLDPSTAQIAMSVGVDNQLLDIEINGVSTGQQLLGVVVGNFAVLHPFSINSGFQPGINTLEFIVQDNGAVSAFRVEITSATADPEETEVDIDIKPGSDPSSVNCKNLKGNVPVAVFGADNFDVSTIDLDTLQLNGVDVTETHNKIHLEDLNNDGFDDAVLHLDKTGVCEATQDAPLKESVDATLTGSNADGDFVGTGDIRIVKR